MRRPSRIAVAVMCTVMITAAGLGRTGSASAGRGTVASTQAVTAANVSSLNPSSGPNGGGTPVTITGLGFTGATAVTFGGAPAGFTVVSDTQITATSPAGQNVVDVIVTTPAGPSAATPADQFTYPTFCVPGTYNLCEEPVVATEGTPFTATVATFTTSDVNAQPAQFSTQISWGDGTVDAGVVVANPDGSFNIVDTHTFGEEGCCEEVNQINITVQDLTRNRATLSTSSTPNIADAPLTASGVAVNPVLNTPFQGPIATFTDADPGGTASDYTATIDWGDGSPPSQGTIMTQGAGFAVAGSHTYTSGGPSTVTVQVTDAGGATTSAATTTVVTQPDHDLTIAQPADITATATSASGAVVSYPLPAVTDEDSSAVTSTCALASGSTFPVGATTVTCTATDADDSNSPVTTSFTVTVTDNDMSIPPPANISATTSSAAGTVVNYAPPRATDEGSDTAPATCTPPPGSTFPVGATTVTCTISDSDDSNSPVTASFTVTVTLVPQCTTTITGTYPGGLVVAKGVTACVTGATVTGGVAVLPGGTLLVSHSHLNGGLLSAGAAGLSVCASQIRLGTLVSGSSGYVLIGDAGDDGPSGCAGNTLNGPVTLLANNGVELGNDTLTGVLSLLRNGGTGTVTETAAPELEANHISSLFCFANMSAPTDDHQPNTIGLATGQCAGLPL